MSRTTKEIIEAIKSNDESIYKGLRKIYKEVDDAIKLIQESDTERYFCFEFDSSVTWGWGFKTIFGGNKDKQVVAQYVVDEEYYKGEDIEKAREFVLNSLYNAQTNVDEGSYTGQEETELHIWHEVDKNRYNSTLGIVEMLEEDKEEESQ